MPRFRGGVTSPSMVWLSIVPLLPMFSFESRRVVSFWLGVSFVSVLGMLGLQFLDVIPSRPGETASDLMYGALTYTLLCYAEWSLIDAVDSMNVTTLRQVNRNNLSLKRLSQDLRQANAHKDQFLAIVSHEMRTPLNAVMGYLSLMSTDPKLEPESKEFVTGAQNSAAHLLTVINDLLDYSQIQNGKVAMNPQIFNLHTMLQTTHSTLSPRAIDLGLTYRVNIAPNVPEWVCADQHRLTQVLINLLGNALKFTDAGHVDMRVSYTSRSDETRSGTLFVHVEDTGPGIPLDAQARIFEPFVQLTRADTGRPSNDALRGNGLGLSISDTLIKSHGGELRVDSTPGKGSTFFFQIPLRVVPPPQKSAPVQERIHTT
jgi:signal transduction histidine kinase